MIAPTTPDDRYFTCIANCLSVGISLADARSLSIYEYSGLFCEFNYRNDPERDKNLPDAPDENFVLEQMALLRQMGVRMN